MQPKLNLDEMRTLYPQTHNFVPEQSHIYSITYGNEMYVGKTDDLNNRYKTHIMSFRLTLEGKENKCKRLVELIQENGEDSLVLVLELTIPLREATHWEGAVWDYYKNKGFKLMNKRPCYVDSKQKKAYDLQWQRDNRDRKRESNNISAKRVRLKKKIEEAAIKNKFDLVEVYASQLKELESHYRNKFIPRQNNGQ